VYRADEQDITYTRDFYNFKEHSLSLLVSKSGSQVLKTGIIDRLQKFAD